jgi:hypothetical protein
MSNLFLFQNLIVSPDNSKLLTIGHNGQMYVLSKNSREVIGNYSINGEVRDAIFTEYDSNVLALSGM